MRHSERSEGSAFSDARVQQIPRFAQDDFQGLANVHTILSAGKRRDGPDDV
jgi:hypothetical protein